MSGPSAGPVELDPQFVKALRLLRSKSADSGIQLRNMLEEAIRIKRGGAPLPPQRQGPQELDRLKKDLSELVQPSEHTQAKRPRMDSPARSSNTGSLSHSPSPQGSTPSMGSEADFGGLSGEGELNMNLEFTDCSCCVCKTFTQELHNKLMECSTCGNLYHQECHSPPVQSGEASDPRAIWNCYKCTRKSSKEKDRDRDGSSSSKHKQEKSSSSGSKSGSGSSSKRSSSSSSKNKSDGHKSSSSGSSSSKSKSSGLSSSSTSSSTGELSSSARKRLKLLKKQAAEATISKKNKK